MSGTLAVFATGLEAVSALDGLQFGSSGDVVLGSFVFFGFEVPASIRFGGRQAATVHKLPGGERVVDLLGPDDINIDWSGTFLDGDIALRARDLDQLRAEGRPQVLSWGDFFYTVLIADTSFDMQYGQIHYRISCLVLRNEANAPQEAGDSLTDTVAADTALALASAQGQATAVAAITETQLVVAAAGSLDDSRVAAKLALAGIAAGLATQAIARGDAESTITAVALAAAPATDLIGSSGALVSAVAAAGAMAAITQSQGFLGRASVNLGGSPWT